MNERGTRDAAAAVPLPSDGFERLIAVMARLRDPERGCPWDLAQSLDSLKPFLVEESYEALDAIDALGAAARVATLHGAPGDAAVTAEVDPALIANHRAELGDVLLQVAFQSQLAAEFGWFTADDVAHGIADKMVRRHPHVFADAGSDSDPAQPPDKITADDVVTNWQAIKAAEARAAGETGVLAGVPRHLPALLRGQRIGAKAAHVGFDWPDVTGAMAKVDEELEELRDAMSSGDTRAIEHELGDVLFALTSAARHLGVDAEQALRTTLDRFQARFAGVERRMAQHMRAGEDQPDLATLERWWQAAKADNAAAERG